MLKLVEKVKRRVTTLCEQRLMTVDDVEADVLEGAIGEAMQSIPVLSMDDESDEDVPDEDGPKVRTSRRCASIDGFSLHANTAVTADNRVGLRR